MFQEILLPSLVNINDMSPICKGNMQLWMETIKLIDNKKLHNVTN